MEFHKVGKFSLTPENIGCFCKHGGRAQNKLGRSSEGGLANVLHCVMGKRATKMGYDASIGRQRGGIPW